MIASAEDVVRGITLNFCLLKYPHCNEIEAVMGGYGCYGETHGVRTSVVGCALACLLGMEYEQYYIQSSGYFVKCCRLCKHA